MNIICPECGQIHNLPDDRLPKRRSATKCKKCGGKIIIDPQPAAIGPDELNRQTETTEQTNSEPHELDVLLTENIIDHAEESPSPAPEEMEILDILGDYNAEATGYGHDIFASFPELEELSPDKFTYEEIFATTKKYGYQTSEDTGTLKIIKAVHDVLTSKILRENEQVKRLARGIAYYPFEIPYANGLLTIFANYYAVVCTNQRLLLVNINSRINRPTRYIFQVPYDGISNVSRGAFLSSLIIESKTGRSWNFTTVRRNLAKSLRDFILAKGAGTESPGSSPEDNGPRQFCPACYTLLADGLAACPQCSVPFKKPAEAITRSLILPGLGPIYLSYLPLGIVEMAGYLAIWLIALVLVIMKVPGGILTGIAPVLTYHLFSVILARKTADKGYIPEKRHIKPPVESEKTPEDLPK
ncbi:MAG: zinc-ribbon domain-containing protein [Thermodesulfobacteriota bacterium]